MRLPLLALAAALPLLGCATGVTVPPLVAGPNADVAPWTLFERAVGAARAGGYEPEGADVNAGVFRVRSQRAADGETVFVTRFYVGGWVRVRPAGPGVRAEGSVARVTPEVRREMVAYQQSLDAALRDAR